MYPGLSRKAKRAVLEENERKESKRKRSEPVVVTQFVVQGDRVTEQEPKRKTMEHPLSNKGVESRVPKATPIIEDYEISSHVLGLGINGKVVQCYDKQKRQKYALKVALRFKFVGLMSFRSLERDHVLF